LHLEKKGLLKTVGFLVLMLGLWIGLIIFGLKTVKSSNAATASPTGTKSVLLAVQKVDRTGVIEVAKVFGRAPGCENTDPDFIEDVNLAAARVGLDAKVAAATVAVESGCNPFAVSNRGAVGLMQIRVIAWKDKYDFSGRINLLNRKDNLQVGTEILAGLVKQFGLAEGVKRYQGLGPGGDEFYVSKILKLAGKK
jgi:Transglycosylase SLT domain